MMFKSIYETCHHLLHIEQGLRVFDRILSFDKLNQSTIFTFVSYDGNLHRSAYTNYIFKVIWYENIMYCKAEWFIIGTVNTISGFLI